MASKWDAIGRPDLDPLRRVEPRVPYWERPCAGAGFHSYRYSGRYGWIMIGAVSTADALREAGRSTDDPIERRYLQRWDSTTGQYVTVEE